MDDQILRNTTASANNQFKRGANKARKEPTTTRHEDQENKRKLAVHHEQLKVKQPAEEETLIRTEPAKNRVNLWEESEPIQIDSEPS